MVKKRLYALCALFLALALSACGAKVHTELKLDSPTSGQRVMRIVIPKLDEQQAQKINGGIDAVEASIKKHLPEELTFSGFSAEGEETVGTLTLEFDSLDTYQTKISALFGNSYYNLKSGIAVTTEGLVTGVQVEENFSSTDLLQWARDGLVEDGVIAETDSNNIMETGDSTITFGDATYDSTSGHLYVSEVTDNGINHLAIAISEKESSLDIKAELGYKKGTKYPEEEFKQYVENNRPKDAKVEDLTSDFNGVSISYSAISLEEAEESLAKLLGDPSFSIKEVQEDSSDNSQFLRNNQPVLTRAIDVAFNCSSLCSPKANDKKIKFTPSEKWTLENSSGEIYQSGKITMYMPIEFSDISVASTLGEKGGTVIMKASLNNGVAELAGDDAISAFLNPKDAGELSTETTSENTVYTLTITGASQEELNAALAETSSGTSYKVMPTQRSGFFKKEVAFTYHNDFGSKFGETARSSVRHTVTIDGYSISASNFGNSAKIETTGDPLIAEGIASTFTLGGLILILGIVFAILVAVGILFWKRKVIAEKLKARKEKQAALQGSQAIQADQGMQGVQALQDSVEFPATSEQNSYLTETFSQPSAAGSASEAHTLPQTPENPGSSPTEETQWAENDLS